MHFLIFELLSEITAKITISNIKGPKIILYLFQINVVCLILSKDVIKSTAVRDTWGSHCNSLKFVSSKKLKVSEELRKKNTSILVTNPVEVEQIPASSEFGLLCKSLRQIAKNKYVLHILF